MERQAKRVLCLRQFWVVLNLGLGGLFSEEIETRKKNVERRKRDDFYRKIWRYVKSKWGHVKSCSGLG
ncbi:hypothetical protein PanWU01x14_099040 [Parasponia andersonii]|uniref:Uncharacterized protein n=1 Tax=Parasponia andersonii TaxID=3476 RepID=A0A2P5D474_PARAD|nr:hypothetical protein PanWU01x14_099040 [Parasponia andersonii]